jgi:hypothetical protein
VSWIHLADSSSDRGQAPLLVQSGMPTLASYEYMRHKGMAADMFEKVWEEQVNLHLVAWPQQEPQKRALKDEGYDKHLMSYADRGNEGAYGEVWKENMHLHLGGRGGPTPGPTGDALKAEKANKHMCSYDHAQAYERQFGEVWKEQNEENMHLHLTSTHGGSEITDALSHEDQDKHLLSNSYRGQEKWFSPLWERRDLRPRVIIDSGAFTAWSTGRVFRPEEYGEWALKFSVRWREKMAALHFINLDVIGDQIASWRNQEKLERMGLHPLPVVTYKADIKHLTHALERYDYICLGGLVGIGRAKLRPWLDYCFKEIMAYRERTGTMRRIHLLGVTTWWVLSRYPVYSSDSSAWTAPLRFGVSKQGGIKGRLPKYKAGTAQLAATLNSLRAEIRHYQKMQDDATKLWSRRGIEFKEEPVWSTA